MHHLLTIITLVASAFAIAFSVQTFRILAKIRRTPSKSFHVGNFADGRAVVINDAQSYVEK